MRGATQPVPRSAHRVQMCGATQPVPRSAHRVQMRGATQPVPRSAHRVQMRGATQSLMPTGAALHRGAGRGGEGASNGPLDERSAPHTRVISLSLLLLLLLLLSVTPHRRGHERMRVQIKLCFRSSKSQF